MALDNHLHSNMARLQSDPDRLSVQTLQIYIPIWQDFNYHAYRRCVLFELIYIPIWQDFNGFRRFKFDAKVIYIPIWQDFNPRVHFHLGHHLHLHSNMARLQWC